MRQTDHFVVFRTSIPKSIQALSPTRHQYPPTRIHAHQATAPFAIASFAPLSFPSDMLKGVHTNPGIHTSKHAFQCDFARAWTYAHTCVLFSSSVPGITVSPLSTLIPTTCAPHGNKIRTHARTRVHAYIECAHVWTYRISDAIHAAPYNIANRRGSCGGDSRCLDLANAAPGPRPPRMLTAAFRRTQSRRRCTARAPAL